MKAKILTSVALLAYSGSLFAQTLATVNGQKIDSSVIDAQVAAFRAENSRAEDSPRLRQALLENEVVNTVVAQEVKRLKLDQSAEFKDTLAKLRAEAKKSGDDKKPSFKTVWSAVEYELNGRAYALHIAKTQPVSEQDAKAAYDNISGFYKGTQEVQLGEVLTDKEDNAKKAVADLKAKKGFDAVLKQYSLNDRAKQTGAPDEYVPLKNLEQDALPLYQAVKDLKKGEFTAVPLKNGDFYGVYYVNDRRDVKVPSFDELKEQIAGDLQAERIDRAVGALLNKADIKPVK
ncbi:peptidyl-prolyl cis-trans isomerase [Neisseria cinerea]|uniref:peptidylprolyl isomerase n=1 Tax=Neisseria cinerea TaxID=483 RepID=A0A7T3BLH4_NEICI|nr:peptidyl-prolyl cis-trans isomerase [Neisseria cinerea]QPT37875.1 peptidyl-prolyl cis-trans isomerase [Neisseria cinerea]SQF82646.1 Cell-binding factor, putative [Neisseria cinerea]